MQPSQFELPRFLTRHCAGRAQRRRPPALAWHALPAAHAGNHAPLPLERVTACASGADPHSSGDLPAAASRGMAPSRLQALIAACTEGRLFGVIGEPRVNARKLNVALDTLK